MDSYLSICQFFEEQSKYVWNRVAFSRQMNIRISEISITEELLYRFHQAYLNLKIPVRLFESVDEHKNGSDVEILIKTKQGYLLLACQAKITYKTGKYKSFHHKVKGVPQIDLLRNYAKKKGGIAQYLFYNFIPDWRSPHKSSTDEAYGITTAPAELLIHWMKHFDDKNKRLKVFGFKELHSALAFPFHFLICSLLKDDKPEINWFPDANLDSLIYYTEAEVGDNNTWRSITTPARIGFVDQTYSSFSDLTGNGRSTLKQDGEIPDFKPKFRLVIGGDIAQNALYSME
jgi:hypothetical protein